jgi:GNAT superfamily N-acetyltransferase
VKQNVAALKADEGLPRSERRPVETDYFAAKSPVSSPDQVVREAQRRAADAAEKDGAPNPLRQAFQKIFVPYGPVRTSKAGNPTVFGMSLDKVVQNVDLLQGWLRLNPNGPDASVIRGYLGSPEIVVDLQDGLRNQSHGYGFDGRKLTLPADARDITPSDPNYTPVRIPTARAQVLNLLMGMEQPQKETPGQAFARRFAEQNGTVVTEINGVSETNPLRARLRAQGFDPRILNAVVENLRVDRMATPLKPRPDLNFSAGDTGIQRAGFMPQPEQKAKRLVNEETRKVAADYMAKAGIDREQHTSYAPIDETRMKRIADWFETAKHEPLNPEVEAAYRSLADETKAQYQQMVDAGIQIEPFTGKGEPYKNSAEMMADVRDNKHLYFLRTENAYGAGDGAGLAANPLLEPSGITIGDTPLLMNDLFRAVHDYFGHTAEGFEFGPRGEFNAYLAHSRMFSDAAKPALAAETLTQNAWVNFGQHLRRPDGSLPKPGEPGYVSPRDRRFADQKTTVVPAEILNEVEGVAAPRFMPQPEGGFYSQLEKTLEAIPPKATRQQIEAALRDGVKDKGQLKARPVKAEEMADVKDLTGVSFAEWLKDHPTATREEMLDFVRGNRVEVSVRSTVEKTSEDPDSDESDVLPASKYESYTLPGGDNYREVVLSVPGVSYSSPHFSGSKGYVAHYRATDRVAGDGQKVTFAEEIQSDLHQEGRKSGYREQVKTEPVATYEDIAEGDQILGRYKVQWIAPGAEWFRVSGPAPAFSFRRLNREDFLPKDVVRGADWLASERTNDGKVADAPFKKSWPEQVFKHLLKDAAEAGSDWVAWTTGKQQADHYDLSKQVSAIRYRKDAEKGGKYEIDAYGKDGDNIVFWKRGLELPEIETLVGKDIAGRIARDEGKTEGGFRDHYVWRNLSGLELAVGGQGMNKFYDEILPSVVDKYLKKFGVKTESLSLPLGSGGPKYAAYSQFRDGRLQWALQNTETGSVKPDLFETRAEAETVAAALAKNDVPEVEVHAVRVTPEMRNTILEEGQPRFMPQPEKIKLGKKRTDEFGDTVYPVIKGKQELGTIEPDYANGGFRALALDREDLGTAETPADAVKFFSGYTPEPAKQPLATETVATKLGKAQVENLTPTGWVLPDGSYAGISAANNPNFMNRGDFHSGYLSDRAPEMKSKFGLELGKDEDIRLAALNKGFIRVRLDGQTGRMGVEANPKFLKGDRLAKLQDVIEENANRIGKLDVNLFNDKGEVVGGDAVDLFRIEDPQERSAAVLEALKPGKTASARFMPQPEKSELDGGQTDRLAGGMTQKVSFEPFGRPGSGDFIARVDGKEIGYASVSGADPERPYLSNIRINEEYRGKGIGSAFYSFIEKELGKKLRPSPLYVSEAAQRVWDRRAKATPRFMVQPEFAAAKPTRDEFLSAFERVKANDNDGATFNVDGTPADTSTLPLIVTLGALTQSVDDATGQRAINFFNRHAEFLQTPNARPGLFRFGDKLSADLNVALPLERYDLAKQFVGDNNQNSFFDASKMEVVETGGSGEPKLTTPLQYAVAAKQLADGTYTSIDEVKKIASEIEGTSVVLIPNIDLVAKKKDAIAEAVEENDGKPLSKIRLNRLTKEVEDAAASRMVGVPVVEISPVKGRKKVVLDPNTPEKWDEVNAARDRALRATESDPEMGLGEFGYRKAFAEFGVATQVPPAPEQFAKYVKDPQLFADMVRKAQQENPALVESALSGLEHVAKMHELARKGKMEPETVALHMAWGIASRMLAPFDQEGGWIRVVRSPEVISHLVDSVHGTYSRSKDEWKAAVQKAMKDSNAFTDDVAASKVGKNAIANLNAFYLMLSKWNGRWDELTSVLNDPKLSGPQMRDEFFRRGFGGAGIKHKVVSFDILTLARDDVFIGDRWQVVQGNLPLLERIAKDRGLEGPFDYDKNGTPQDRVGIYGAYGPLLDAPSVAQLYYALVERAMTKIGDSQPVRELFGKPLSASAIHWLSWNIIKNEPVGHSSLEITHDLLASEKTLRNVGRDVLANELATRPLRTQRYNPTTKRFDEFTVENNRAILRRSVGQ